LDALKILHCLQTTELLPSETGTFPVVITVSEFSILIIFNSGVGIFQEDLINKLRTTPISGNT
jgi:hypothetical protein